MQRSDSDDPPPPALPPRPGGRAVRSPPAAPPEEDFVPEDPYALYDDFEESSNTPSSPEIVYDDCEENAPPPLHPHPESFYDDCEEQKPPPPPQRPKAAIPPLAAPQRTHDDRDSVGPIVQQIPKRQLPRPPVQSPPPNTKNSVGQSPYEVNDGDYDPEPEQHMPPPPPALEDPSAIYEVEPEVDPVDPMPSLPPPPLVPHPPPKIDRPAKLPPPPTKTVTSPGPKSGTPAGGFAIGLGQLQNLKAGLKKVSLDNSPSETSNNNHPKMYEECPHTVYDAKKIFQEKSAEKPEILTPKPQIVGGKVQKRVALSPGSEPQQAKASSPSDPVVTVLPKANKDKHNTSALPVQPVKPVLKYQPSPVELDASEDIYDDASSAVLDPLSKYPWYHGDIDRPVGEKKVKAIGKDGTFLVRVSDKDPKFPYTLVVLHNGHVNNLRIRQRLDKKVALGDEKSAELAFQDVPAMIEHHQNHNVVLLGSTQSQVKLLHIPPKG